MREFFFQTENMTVGYDGKPLIREIALRVRKGEILTLIGPNGAGKSTILKSITRQLRLIGGTVYLDGRQMPEMTNKEVATRMAVVLTERIRPELMTCAELVATGRYPYTGALGILSPKDWGKVRRAMELVHAMDLWDRDFLTVSDGQRQRILLARAICQEPEMIVLDEPTSFLDIKHKLELLTILKSMAAEGSVAVVLSLHELDLAQKVSDYVVCVKGEYIEKHGTPDEIFTSAYISELYEMTNGSYNANFGSLEMEPAAGKPRLFVIAGGGSGVLAFRRLQRKGVPFAAGILHKNDIDYEVAKALACRVAAEEAFEPISDAAFARGKRLMEECGRVWCCLERFGTMNRRNEELLRLARERGMLDVNGT